MSSASHSIDIRVPARIAYDRLARFEDYSRFIVDVEAVRRLDDTHLHWIMRIADRPLEWDAEITEQEPDRCIAWRSTGGRTNGGRVEVQAVGPDASRVTLTLESAQEQVPASPAGNSGEDAALRLEPDMARLKDFIEGRGTREQRQGARLESRSTESDYSLSQPAGNEIDEGPFSVSEEVSLDQQSDTVRHVGQLSQDAGAQAAGETPVSDAMGEAMRRNAQDTKDDPKLKQSIERAVPPSE